MDNKYKILIITSFGLFCLFKPKPSKKKEYKIPEINDPWLYLQYGGPGIEKTV
tara:strand:+ start:98 stop:256 length:159 start_codon:yes stop_codon:yes gene_type:complete